jgi:hypothetical protein
MAISEIKLSVKFHPRWYLKAVATAAYITHRCRLISADRFGRIVVGCYDIEVVK